MTKHSLMIQYSTTLLSLDTPSDAVLGVQISALDIESTLRHVVDQVVLEKGTSKDEKKKRARGVMRLGKVFLEASGG